MKANLFERHGNYSQALVQADVNNITALYQSNGFNKIKITPEVKRSAARGSGKPEGLWVTYRIDEGVQEKIGKYEIAGNKQIPIEQLKPAAQSGRGTAILGGQHHWRSRRHPHVLPEAWLQPGLDRH